MAKDRSTSADGRWAATLDLGWQDGKRKRKTVYGRTRAEVADKLTPMLKARQDGLPIVPRRKLLGAFLGLSRAVTPESLGRRRADRDVAA